MSHCLLKAICASMTLVAFVALVVVSVSAKGNFAGKTARPLRYQPDGSDFVIENGKEFFNRPLYGTNTAFRVDAGDRPEFLLYMPGRGGNHLTAHFNDVVTQIFRNEYLSPRSPYVSLAIPKQGIGSWARWSEKFDVDDTGLRAAAAQNGGRLLMPQGFAFKTPGASDSKNVVFTTQWDNYPKESSVLLTGKAIHVYLLIVGSSNQMQSRFDNGEVIVTYGDGAVERLALHNPTTWWPIDQDYLIDDYAFRRPEPIPPRVDLQTGNVRILELAAFKGKGTKVPGGAATVLDLPLDGRKELKSLTVRTLANEVVIGLMGVTLVRN